MQVAHTKDYITHAVIGGAATIDFGISSSAEFFNILSSTLYKDQILAVVREVLCNAWDAHIEAGRTHIPVEITLTTDKFMIKDVGTGIHRDDMGLIYGTYGNSTKKNDGQQTGGFGLGCKAPFAYTDHFEVISCHDGVRMIYNLSKSSAAAQGKPGIVPIASFPTQDTGLQVSIGIHNRTDFERFRALIQRIAKNGDMNMQVNGQGVYKLGFDTSKSNFLVTMETDMLDKMTPIMVRYGNVIYPVDEAKGIDRGYFQVTQHLNRLRINRNNEIYRIIFQAPPHSISVTPSRESLSMQEHTIKTLNTLFADFMKTINGEFVPACDAFAKDVVDAAITDVRMKDLLCREMRLPGIINKTAPTKIVDLVGMARRFMESNYPNDLTFRKKDMRWRLQGMVDAGLLDRGLVQTWLREMDKTKTIRQSSHWSDKGSITQWLQRQVTAPLLVKMQAAGIDTSRLYVFDPEDSRVPDNWGHRNIEPMVRATESRPVNLFNTLPYLRNILVISTSGKNIKDRAERHEVFDELGKGSGYFFYRASMKKKDRDTELEFFKTSGMTIVDLTMRQAWEGQIVRTLSVPRKPTKKGLPSLKGILLSDKTIDTKQLLNEYIIRNLAPEFSICVSLRQEEAKNQLGSWDDVATRYIIELFGDKGGVINNSALHSKAIKAGAMEMDAYLEKKLVDFMEHSTVVHQYWAYDCNRLLGTNHIYREPETSLIKLVYDSKTLCDQFGLVNNLSENDKKMVYLWHKYCRINRYNLSKDVQRVVNLLDSISLHQANVDVLAKFKNPNPLLKVFDQSSMAKMLNTSSANSTQIKKLVQILAIALDN